MSRDSGSKIGQHWNVSGMSGFKVKRNQQILKDVKLYTLQNDHLGLSKFWVFDPQKSLFFSQISAQNIQNFIDIRKTEYML